MIINRFCSGRSQCTIGIKKESRTGPASFHYRPRCATPINTSHARAPTSWTMHPIVKVSTGYGIATKKTDETHILPCSKSTKVGAFGVLVSVEVSWFQSASSAVGAARSAPRPCSSPCPCPCVCVEPSSLTT